MSKHVETIVEAALYAKACLFFVPTALCIGIVGAAVFLSAKSMLADDHAKDVHRLVDAGLKKASHWQEALAIPGFPTDARSGLKAQRMDECHSGGCLYRLQPAYVSRLATRTQGAVE